MKLNVYGSSVGRFLPFLFSLLLTLYSYLGFYLGSVNPFFILVFILIIPGFVVSIRLSRELELSLEEFIVLTIVFSGMIMMFLYMTLTCLFAHVSLSMVFAALTCFLLVFGFLEDLSSECFRSIDWESILGLAGLLVCFFVGFLGSSLYMPSEFWRGPDGWANANVFRTIAETGFSPIEAYNFFRCYVNLPNPGFYHYFSVLHLVTGFSVESIMRYGGLIQTGLFVSLAYITFKRVNGLLPGLSGVFLLILNPYLNHRFMVLLREEFSLFFLFTGLFLYVCYRDASQWSSPFRVVVMGSLLASCLLSHPMVPWFFICFLVCQIGCSFIERRHDELRTDLYSIVLGLTLILPFYNIMLDPMVYFLSRISSFYLLVGVSLAAAVSITLYLFYIRKPDLDHLFPVAKRILVIFMFIFPVLGIAVKPEFGESYSFGFIDVEDFSRILVPLSVAGYFLYHLGATERVVVGLNLVISSLIATSYLGVPVPLDRLSIPLMWLMSFYASYLVKASSQVSFHDTSLIKQCSGLMSRLMGYRMTLVFILMILAGGMVELSSVTRKPSTFNTHDVEDTRMFVSTLDPGELVFPYGVSDHMLYYTGISEENLVTDLDVKHGLESLEYDSVHQVSDLVHANYPDVEALLLYVHGWDEYHLRETPFGRLLDIYFEKASYGTFSSYKLEIPFSVEKLNMGQIKYIEDSSRNSILGSDEEGLNAVSNCVYLSGDERPYRFLFVQENPDDSQILGLASSNNGREWNVESVNELDHELNSLSIVKHDGVYYLYAGTSEDMVVRLESRDLRTWDDYIIVYDSFSMEELTSIESPLVWFEDGIFRMMFWGTNIDDPTETGLYYAMSVDGVTWEKKPGPLGWVLMDSRGRYYRYEKIMPTDVVYGDEGYTLLAKMYMENNAFDMNWATGSITLENVTYNAGKVRCFVYKDHLESRMDSVHLIRDIEGTRLGLIYIEEEGRRVFVGAVSDHDGLDEKYLALP
ncbi:MAG: hypothetical protein JRJ69_04035 [Deltaproteobacteria bacterium]|nr:hypothetical protein [Deltaproteobacteria bacterium]